MVRLALMMGGCLVLTGARFASAQALIPSAPGTITLRPCAVVTTDSDILLRDVAVLRGGAVEFSDHVIRPAPEGQQDPSHWSIGPNEVSAALGEIENLDWSLLMLRGAPCDVRIERMTSNNLIAEQTSAGVESLSRFEGFTIGSSIPGGTVRGYAASSLASLFGVSLGDVRISFERAGAALLDIDTYGLTIQANPLGAGDRVPVRIRVFDPDGEQLVRNDVVHARVELRANCARVRSTLRRGSIVDADAVTISHEWVSPSLRASPAGDVVGSALRRTLEGGRVVTESDIEPPLLVQRGDKVAVHCLSGSLVLRVTARALDSGRRGEVIELESLEADRRERRRFAARVSGPGEVVASADTDLMGARGVGD